VDHLERPRLVARRLLDWWADQSPAQTGTPATPIDDLTKALGLEVSTFHPSARRGGILGWLEPGEDLIFIRDGLPEPVRRFTLAHELGHALLHRAGGDGTQRYLHAVADAIAFSADLLDASSDAGPAEECDDGDLDAPLDVLNLGDETLRPGQAYSARARRESEANAFAAALLLPPARLRALFLGEECPAHDPTALAERFVVSEETVHQALGSLLLPAMESDDPSARLGGSTARPPLDRWQQAAASAEAPALVVAGPGTGKTSTLIGRVAHLVLERGVPPAQILALTFSNKAAQEMRERIEAFLTSAPEARAYADDLRARPTVSTIHAYCGDLLRRFGPLVGLRSDYRLINEVEGYLLLRQVSASLILPHYQPLGAPAMHFPTLLSAISRAKDELADPQRYAACARQAVADAHTPDEREAGARALEVARIYATYQHALDEAGNADFGDMIRLAVRLLSEHPLVLEEQRTLHPHILVDEFQDINRAMGVLLQVLAGADGRIWAVGDADQAIYRFRGASPANLARFTEAYPRSRLYPLGTNYRSRPPILRAAAGVAAAFLGERERAVLEAAHQPDEGAQPRDASRIPSVTLATAPDEASELAGIVAAIQEQTRRGYRLADQAVLCRTRRQCQRVAAALDAVGLRARVITPLLEQPEIKGVLAVALLLMDDSGSGLLRAGSVPEHAFTRPDARALLRYAQEHHLPPVAILLDGSPALDAVPDLSDGGRQGLARLGAVVRALWRAPDVATGLARYLFTLTEIGRRTLAEAGDRGSARATHLARLLALARAYEDGRRGAERVIARSRAEGAHWDEFLDYVRVLTALGREAGGDADDLAATDGVRVLTVHGSKGLEFPIVYLAHLAEGRFPTQRRADPAPIPPGLREDADASSPARDHLIEEACLFYVAITRARDALVISRAERYGRRRAAASPFLHPLVALAASPDSGIVQVRWPHVQLAVPTELAPVDADDDVGVPLPASAPGDEALPANAQPLTVGAIETYDRCPRQYAYRYVYGLRPREVGLGTLRRSLHATLRDLQVRFGSRTAIAGTGADGEGQPLLPFTLSEARDLFEQHWRDAVGAVPAADAPAERDQEGPFGVLYRRYGLRVVERSWLDLLRERGLPLPDGGAITLDETDGMSAITGDSESQLGDRTPLSKNAPSAHAGARLPLDARLEERVQVRIGGRTIEVTLDRIDGAPGDDARSPAARAPIAPDAALPDADVDPAATRARAPVRFVRHRLGGSSTATSGQDLRALLYALAAEQHRKPGPAELYQHNLITGELERVQLDARKQSRLRETLIEAISSMESGSYPAKPDPFNCQSCPFLLVCPA
jgi:ATP-dependent DNA helicase UvrD/PcrA